MQNLPVIFAVDRSGLVGKDGETHQGIYDISFLAHIPGLVVMAPKNRYELADMMDFAYHYNGPSAILYSKGNASKELAAYRAPIELNKSEIIYSGEEISIIAVGNMMEEALKLTDMLKSNGINPTLVNARFVSSVDEILLDGLCENSGLIVTMEENISAGGYGEKVAAYVAEKEPDSKVQLYNVSVKTGYVEQGDIKTLRKMLRIDAETIYSDIKQRV
jgi:1-deoxy-D-xylulose-5-phosphate synthase